MTIPHNSLSKAYVTLCLILLMAVAIYIRVHGANAYHYYGDEWAIVQIAKGSTLQQVLQFSIFETHPPLLYVLLHYWMKISDAPAFVRSFSLLSGIALIPLYYHIGKKLSGELMGICCAALVAFSHSCIIQSYIVRQYAVLMFMLSAAFYCYLLWSDERKNNHLLGYIFVASLACLTHFSAIYAIFCIAIAGMVRMHGTASRFEYIKWIGANSIMAALFLITFMIWSDSLVPMHASVGNVMTSLSISDKLLLALSYPFYLAGYIFPGTYFILLLILLMPLAMANKTKGFRSLLSLAAGALLLGMILLFTGIYPFGGDRHSLWALPFIILAAGQIMASALGYIYVRLETRNVALHQFYGAHIFTITIILCVAFYNPHERFSDSTEYRIKTPEWNEVQNYLKQVAPSDLIVASRIEATILAPAANNIYSYFENTDFSLSPEAGYAPYYNTHVLFNNRRNIRIYDNNGLLQMLKDADGKGILGSYDNLIFVHSYNLNSPSIDLLMCKSLEKKIVSFPATMQDQAYTKSEITNEDVIFIVVKKRDFFNEVIAPTGKAHKCLAVTP